MIDVLLAAAFIFMILVFAEYARRRHWTEGEGSRKFVHIAVAGFIATWPFYMSFRMIEAVSVALLLAVVVSKRLNIFRSIHTVKRHGLGEAAFAAGIGLTALVSPNKWIFAAAMLHVSFADGLAGLIGSEADNDEAYKILGERRTLQGTLAFLLMSLLIVSWVLYMAPAGLPPARATLVWLPLATAAVENISVYGFDNLIVPLFIATVLKSML